MTVDDDYDERVYAPSSEWRPDPELPEGGAWHRKEWRELAGEWAEQVRELQGWRTLVTDLDRNEHGRHEGDADVGDPTGVSQGNPLLPTGTVLGHSLGGSWQYVMPPRGERHKLTAWRRRAESPQAGRA